MLTCVPQDPVLKPIGTSLPTRFFTCKLMAPVSSFNFDKETQSRSLLEAWKPLHGDAEWACLNITHATCSKFNALCCPDGCLCARIMTKIGNVDHVTVLDPGAKAERTVGSDMSDTDYTAIEIMEQNAIVTHTKVPEAKKLFVIMSDMVLPLCTPDEEDAKTPEAVDALCVERFNKYTDSLLKHFEQVHLVIFDHHTTQARNFARIAGLANAHDGSVQVLNVLSNATLSYSEPSSWTALKLSLAWSKQNSQFQIKAATRMEIVACFAAAMGDAVNFRKPHCRQQLRYEFSELLDLGYVVDEKLAICAANELVKTGQQSVPAHGVHELAKGMWSDLSKVEYTHFALQDLNEAIIENSRRVYDILTGKIQPATDINGVDNRVVFEKDWNGGYNVLVNQQQFIRVLSLPSHSFSYWVNTFVSEKCAGVNTFVSEKCAQKDSSYIGVAFGQQKRDLQGMGSLRLREDMEDQLTVKQILLSNKCQIATALGKAIGKDGHAFFRGHDDMMVMFRNAQMKQA